MSSIFCHFSAINFLPSDGYFFLTPNNSFATWITSVGVSAKPMMVPIC